MGGVLSEPPSRQLARRKKEGKPPFAVERENEIALRRGQRGREEPAAPQ